MTQVFGTSSHDVPLGRRPWGAYNFLSHSSGFHMDMHAHDYLQLVHVLEGELEIGLDGGQHRLGPGDVHLLPPGPSHSLYSPAGYRQFGVNFTSEADDRGLLRALTRTFAQPTFFHLPFRDVWQTTLDQNVLADMRADWLRVFHTLDDYGISLLEARAARTPEPRARQLMELLSTHLDQPLSVTAMAREMHVSRATLQRLCQSAFGCGAAHLHERLRLQHAAEILLQAELSISECASVCGYADVFHFSRAFKRVFGQSPRVYREQRRAALS